MQHVWATDATTKLQVARKIGNDASLAVQSTQQHLIRSAKEMNESLFLLDAISGQLQLLQTISDSFGVIRKDKEHSFRVACKEIDQCQRDITIAFDRLKGIVVDIGERRDMTLYDFVSDEIVDLLKSGKIELARRFDALGEGGDVDLTDVIRGYNDEVTKLEKTIDEITDKEGPKINSTLEEITALEQEIADLIESITAHYDQTQRGLDVADGKIDMTEEEKKELFDVLANDYQRVPEVVQDLEECYAEIQQKCLQISPLVENQEAVHEQLKALTEKMSEFGHRELKSSLKSNEAVINRYQDTYKEVLTNCEESRVLLSHYNQFIKSYYSLVVELERRQIVQEKIRNILLQTQSQLEAIQEDDIKQRDTFFQTHGEFLPNDWAPLMDLRSALFSMDWSLSDVPSLSKSTIQTAKRMLKP